MSVLFSYLASKGMPKKSCFSSAKAQTKKSKYEPSVFSQRLIASSGVLGFLRWACIAC